QERLQLVTTPGGLTGTTMQYLLDHLAAMIIGTAVFLIVLLVNQSDREALTDTSAFYVMIRQQEEFAKILTRDLQSVEALVTAAEANGDFSFSGHIGNDPTLYDITYRRELARQQDGVSYYRIKRLVDGQTDGGSADIITAWEIEGRDASGEPVSVPGAAVQIFVRFEVGSLIGKKARIERSYRAASFFPPLLQ
ncbi:MAG: hypothetical protein ACE10K_02370, partial [Rhodothermales bacterium]